MNAREIAETYFHAWTSGKAAEARAQLDDHVQLDTPINSYHGAERLMTAVMRFAGMLRKATLQRCVAEGDQVALFYDCETTRAGLVRTAELVRVSAGKIVSIQLWYDATELRKVIPKEAA